MKRKLFISSVLSLLFIIAPFFLLSFEVISIIDNGSVVQEELDEGYKEVTGKKYDNIYDIENNNYYENESNDDGEIILDER